MSDYSGYIQALENTREKRVKERETYRLNHHRVSVPFKAFLTALHEAGLISQPKEEIVGLDDCDLVFSPNGTQHEMRLKVRYVRVREEGLVPEFTWTVAIGGESSAEPVTFKTKMPESISPAHNAVYTRIAEIVGHVLANAHNIGEPA